MSKDKVLSLAKAANNGQVRSPEDALKDALNDIGKNGAFKNGKKILILALDEDAEQYAVSFIQAGMKMSECLALCEIAKTVFLEEMGYINVGK